MSVKEIESRDTAAAPPAPQSQPQAQPQPSVPARRRRWRKPLLLVVPLVVVAIGAFFYFTGGRYVSTDNAYVRADNVTISAEVSGPIAAVVVRDNEHVAKGQVLFRIDEQPFRVALDRAEAALRAQRDTIESLKAQYGEAVESLKLAEANAAFAKREYDRQAKLAKTKVASESTLDSARNKYDQATQQIAVTRQQIAQIRARLGGDPDAPSESQAAYLQAKAAVAQAALDLAHTAVHAPFAGIASNKPQPGAYVTAGNAVMSVVADEGVWIEANFKETDLTHVVPGESVTVSVDTYPDHEWHGTVESISQATGAVFSVIPPQNATGNWVKVVQRIPVRIALKNAADAPPLRAGMSTQVDIDTGSRHRLTKLVQSVLPWQTVHAEAAPMDTQPAAKPAASQAARADTHR
jgi:membrane fusion protein, multidrug efflux system